jgi:hypothetical protein
MKKKQQLPTKFQKNWVKTNKLKENEIKNNHNCSNRCGFKLYGF